MKIPLLIRETSNLLRNKEPFTKGISLPRNQIFDGAGWFLEDGMNTLPVQYTVLDCWPDGSHKWVLFDFQVSLNPLETKEVSLCASKEMPESYFPSAIRIQKESSRWNIHTGETEFILDSSQKNILAKVTLKNGDSFDLKNSEWVLADLQGINYQLAVNNLKVETSGPLKTTLKMDACWPSPRGKCAACFTIRFTFYFGKSICKVEAKLWNPHRAKHRKNCWDLGDPGSLLFQKLSWDIPMDDEGPQEIFASAEIKNKLRLYDGQTWSLFQASSGGKHWNSHNHVNRQGVVPLQFNGYHVEYDLNQEEGLRAQPVLVLSKGSKNISVSVEKFWQNFPKSLEWNKGVLSIGLFPRQQKDGHELQGGESKTHTVYLDFDCGKASEAGDSLKMFLSPSMIMVPPSYWISTSALGDLTLPQDENNHEYAALINQAIDGKNSFFKRREIIDEYGWRHFGCLYADHEAGFTKEKEPLVAHYNNQYDALQGFILQYIRSGDSHWWHLADDLARHVMDIDIYHTSEDRAAYNGGLFWHTEHYRDAGFATHRTYTAKPLVGDKKPSDGGGPSNEHNYTTGLALYYLLTGDPSARCAVLELAEWVIQMEDGSKSRFRFLDRGATGLSSQTASPKYHGPGRGAGNSINALLDAYDISKDPRYLQRAELLIKRCVHPRDDLQKRNLDQPEIRWSYLVFLKALGRYLEWKEGCEEFDALFFYARESLLHYTRWMLDNERPYTEVKEKVLIWTESWPALDMLKSRVFDLAAKYSCESIRKCYLDKMEYFYRRCMNDLEQFETLYFTRPLVILMVNGVFRWAYQGCGQRVRSLSPIQRDFGFPKKFISQKTRAKIKLGILLLLLLGGLAILVGRNLLILDKLFCVTSQRSHPDLKGK